MCFAPAYTYIRVLCHAWHPQRSEEGDKLFWNWGYNVYEPQCDAGNQIWSYGRVASANAPALQQNCLKVLEFDRKFLSCVCAVFALDSTAHQSTAVLPQGRRMPTKHGSVPNGHWGHVGMPYPKQHHPQNQWNESNVA